MTDLISRVTEIAEDLDTLVDDEMIATLREAANALEALRADRDLFRDETMELVRQNGEWQARAERLTEAGVG